jgi:hypothetical protein
MGCRPCILREEREVLKSIRHDEKGREFRGDAAVAPRGRNGGGGDRESQLAV